MPNTVYSNFILESALNEVLETAISAKSLMTVDTSLEGSAGVVKTINRYTYTGGVDTLDVGEGNEDSGSISYTPDTHTVQVLQGRFSYYDEDAMKDPQIVGMMLEGQTKVMANKLTEDFYTEANKASLAIEADALGYDAVVDAIAKMNTEAEDGLFVLVNPEGLAAVRHDELYVNAQAGSITRDGVVGSICGCGVVVSKSVPENTAFVLSKKAITAFVKKNGEVEQERDANTRENTVYLRSCYVVALTDETKIVKITY